MSTPTTCFGVEIPDLNVNPPIALHEVQPNETEIVGALKGFDTPMDRIRALFLSKAHTDFKIILSKSGEHFQVHKLILSMTSPIFSKIFSNESQTIVLDDNPDAMKWILMHAYLGHCELPSKVSEIILLHETLHKYAIKQMAKKCILTLMNYITFETLNDIYTVSIKFNEKTLQRKCTEQIEKCSTKVLELAEKGNISSDLLLYILELEDLKATEIDIFKAVVSWAKHKGKNEKEENLNSFLKPYLHEIDFLSMLPEEVIETVASEDIFTKEEIVGILMAIENVSDYESVVEESSRNSISGYNKYKFPSSYPLYLRTSRKYRRLHYPEINGKTCQIFIYLKCDHRNKWLLCGYYPILTLQVSEQIFVTRLSARLECFMGENFLEILDQDQVLGSSSLNGPPWEFRPPVDLKRNISYAFNLNGKGRICKHEIKMFAINHYNIEFCGNSILCDVSIKYIR